MAKRKLVEVDPSHHRQFAAIQNELKRRNEMVPTIPYILRVAVEHGMKATVERFLSRNLSNK